MKDKVELSKTVNSDLFEIQLKVLTLSYIPTNKKLFVNHHTFMVAKNH